MLIGMNALLIEKPLRENKDSKVLASAIKQQTKAIRSLNNMLGCARPDKFKIAYDQRQIDIANGVKNLPPLKQV